jgi:acetyltransferase-like isoleucine patch superfamily enzyme
VRGAAALRRDGEVNSDFLTPPELAALGLAACGRSVLVSRHAVLFRPECISLGDHTRVDAFCILSAGPGRLRIGRNIHISAYCAVLGREAIEIGDFATISARCTIFSSNDDYSGATMANATIPPAYRGASDAPVHVKPHAIIGAGYIILPGVTLGQSACVGAMSLVKGDVPPFAVVAGVPARVIGRRQDGHLALTEQWLRDEVHLNAGSQA